MLLILFFYVDGMIIAASFNSLGKLIIQSLSFEFAMKDLDSFALFPGYYCYQTFHVIFLISSKYTTEIIVRAGMA